jgi:hypothetical protein
MSEDLTRLFHEGRIALGMTAVDAAALMGASRRTSQRWSAGRTTPGIGALHALAVAVLPTDPKLAARIHAAAVECAARAGMSVPPLAPPPAAPAPAPPVYADAHAVDIVLCAAADAMNLAPRAVRPGLLAGLLRARELSLGVDAMIAALSAAKTAKRTGKAAASRRST